MVDLTSTALGLIALYGPLAVATFTFLESSMLFPFLPSEVVVPAAAALLVTDAGSFVTFVGAAGGGGTVGALLLFYAFYGPDGRRADGIREWLRLSEDQLERSRRWFLRWGASSVLWGRFLPGLRSLVSIPAGIFGMHPVWFTVYTAVGTTGFYAAVAAAVYGFRQRSLFAALRGFAVGRPVLSSLAAAGALAVVVLSTLLYRRSGIS